MESTRIYEAPLVPIGLARYLPLGVGGIHGEWSVPAPQTK